jgi:hypothetical protein
MAKRTATSRNIAAINRNVASIADIFGTDSQQYAAAIADLFQFDVYTNKSGVIQIRNNKSNRAKHQKIRARRNRNKTAPQLRAMKKRSEQAMQKYNKHARSKGKVTNIKEFEKRQQDADDLQGEIYMAADTVTEYGDGSEPDRNRMFYDVNYREEIMAKARKIEEALQLEAVQGKRATPIIYENEPNTVYVIDDKTGEIIYKF